MGIPAEDHEAAEAAKTFQDLVDEANATFDQMCVARHEMGQLKYGPVKFMDVNTLKEASEEIIDLANYARYTFIKLYILNQQIDKLTEEAPDLLGPNSFMANGT
jgi:hypothetical protein